MSRIIAGTHKGRALSLLKGQTTRPSSDRLKEALFSSLESLYDSFEGRRVLDFFAGSGGLGFEALSRGAASVHFFEKDRNALEVIKKNARSLQLLDQIKISQVELKSTTLTLPLSGEYDLVLFDPPYEIEPELVLDLITMLANEGRIKNLGIIVYEHGHKSQTQPAYELGAKSQLVRLKSKKYGTSYVDIFEYIKDGKSDD